MIDLLLFCFWFFCLLHFSLDITISNIEEELTQTIPAPKRIKKDSLVSRKPLRAQRTGTDSQTIEL